MRPWHFGGDPYLTFGEVESYAHAAKELNEARKKASRRKR